METLPVIDGTNFDRESETISIPHDHQHILGKSRVATPEDTKRAIEAALSAREAWASLPWQDRAAIFLKAADLLTITYRHDLNGLDHAWTEQTAHQAEIEAACELADFLRFNCYFAQKIYEEQPLHSLVVNGTD